MTTNHSQTRIDVLRALYLWGDNPSANSLSRPTLSRKGSATCSDPVETINCVQLLVMSIARRPKAGEWVPCVCPTCGRRGRLSEVAKGTHTCIPREFRNPADLHTEREHQ